MCDLLILHFAIYFYSPDKEHLCIHVSVNICARSIFRTGKKCWGHTLFSALLITALPFPLSFSPFTIITAINYESFHGWTERLRLPNMRIRERKNERETNSFHRFIILKWLPWQKKKAQPVFHAVCSSTKAGDLIFSLLIQVATQWSRRGLGACFP